MAEYWGLEAIARRLGVAIATVQRWYECKGLLMYKRRPSGASGYWGQPGYAWDQWYTNDALLTAWEIAYAKQWREKVWSAGRKQRRAAQEPHVELAPTMEPSASPPDVVTSHTEYS